MKVESTCTYTLNYKSICTLERYRKRDVFASIMLSIARICLPSRTTRVHTSSHQSNSKHIYISLCNLYNSISSRLIVQHWSHYLADYYIHYFPLHLTWIRNSNGNGCFWSFASIEVHASSPFCFVPTFPIQCTMFYRIKADKWTSQLKAIEY